MPVKGSGKVTFCVAAMSAVLPVCLLEVAILRPDSSRVRADNRIFVVRRFHLLMDITRGAWVSSGGKRRYFVHGLLYDVLRGICERPFATVQTRALHA
jgi:hypothetical protein